MASILILITISVVPLQEQFLQALISETYTMSHKYAKPNRCKTSEPNARWNLQDIESRIFQDWQN